MCFKGASRGSACICNKHRGLDLDKALGIEIFADGADDLRTLDKGILDLGIHNEVEISLTVAGINVCKSVELFGQGAQRLRKHLYLLCVDAYLAHSGAKNKALNTDNITDIPFLEVGVNIFSNVVYTDVALNSSFSVCNRNKACLAHYTEAHNTSGNANCSGLLFVILEFCLYILRIRGKIILYLFKGIISRRAHIGELFTANAKYFTKLLLGYLFGFLYVIYVLIFCHFKLQKYQ